MLYSIYRTIFQSVRYNLCELSNSSACSLNLSGDAVFPTRLCKLIATNRPEQDSSSRARHSSRNRRYHQYAELWLLVWSSNAFCSICNLIPFLTWSLIHTFQYFVLIFDKNGWSHSRQGDCKIKKYDFEWSGILNCEYKESECGTTSLPTGQPLIDTHWQKQGILPLCFLIQYYIFFEDVSDSHQDQDEKVYFL